MELSQRAKAIKAANAVRRVIQRLRLATPETIDELEAEAFDVMSANLEEIGDQHEKVQEELDKGLELGRKHADQVLERREKEAELVQRPKELMEEIKGLVEDLVPKAAALEAAAGLEGGEVLTPEAALPVRQKAEDLSKDIKGFSQACVAKATEIKAVKLPPETHKEWTQLAQQIVQAKQRCERAATAAKNRVNEVLSGIRKEKAEKRKAEIRSLIDGASSAVLGVEAAVRSAELEVEPFIKGKLRPESEMLALATTVEASAAKARKAVEDARRDVKPPAVEEEDPELLAELQAFVDRELTRPLSRLSLLDRRVVRINNIVRNYRQDLRAHRNRELLEGLKAELLEKVKDADASVISSIEPALKEAEKVVLPTLKNAKMSLAEMQSLAELVTSAVEAAKAEFAKVEKALCPIDDSLDEDLKRKLRLLAAPQLKVPLRQLSMLDRRLRRVRNLLKMFQVDMADRRGGNHKQARKLLLRLARRHMSANGLDPDALFEAAAADAGSVDESAFVSFCENFDRKVPKDDSEELETLEISTEDLLAVFGAATGQQEGGRLDRDAFVKCLCGRMTVVKPTTLTSDLNISEGKMLRALKAAETLEVLEGPVREKRTGVRRMRVKAVKDGKVGWATLVGNAGSIFLKDADV